MFFCCYSGKDPLECNVLQPELDSEVDNDLNDESTDTTFAVCPQLFFSHFTKLIYLKHFLSFKKNYFERNSIKSIRALKTKSKNETKQLRIKKEIELLKSIHMEHIAGNKHNHLL